MQNESGMTVNQLINKAFFILAMALATRFLTKADQMSESMSMLNERLAVVISRMEVHDHVLENHEGRLHSIETHRK